MYCFTHFCMATINISIPDELYNQIKKYSEKFDLKISSIFRRGAKELIEKEKWNQ